MKSLSDKQRELISEFLANIGVAWFAAGVIGVFISRIRSLAEVIVSISWGIVISLIFLSVGVYLTRR